ncbi:MAG: M48 family metalloprotease [Terriglobales bacterium]
MRQNICRILITLLFASWTQLQAVPVAQTEAEAAAWSNLQLARRIFAGEQMTIAQVSKREPIMESYVQSLDPEQHPESVLDDAYFLGRVALDVDSARLGRLQRLAFGASENSRRIRVNTGDRWPLYPEGYVDMLFVDLGDFDKDHYQLSYQGADTLAGKKCLRVRVHPLDPKTSGRFVGEIWVDSASFRIVRIAGTFSPKRLGFFSKYFNASGISRLGLYFHFESWRQEVSPGVWLPSYTYFDEQRMWNTGRLTTSFHLRGHVWVWNYQTAESRTSSSPTGPFGELEVSGLLASPGKVEESLNQMVEEIRSASGIAGPGITCRVLLTTPVEVFSIDHTVLLSRGLLNIVPDKSTLAGLVAREIAHIVLGHSRQWSTAQSSVFDMHRTSDFPGLGLAHAADEEASASNLMRMLLKDTHYADSVAQVVGFLAGLAIHSSQTPHLTSPSFGPGLPEQAVVQAMASHAIADSARASKRLTLELRGEYGINSWENQIVALGTQPLVEEPAAVVPGRAPGNL